MSKLSEILEDPSAMEKIKSIAESLGGGMGEVAASEKSASAVEPDNSAFGPLSGLDGSRAVALLEALRPFMRESRIPKVNTAIKAVQMMSVLSKIK